MANNLGAVIQADLLKLILNGTAIANIADDAASAPLTNLYVSLHTADPTNAGNQTSNEVSYSAYARTAIARSSTGPAWGVTGSSPAVATPNAAIVFPSPTGATGQIATHAAIGTSITGTGKLIVSGALTPNITIQLSVPPTIATTSQITMD
ncbi:MAG: hypothetical protein PHQ40_12810 [Anaerolineaceae bacterium]|nr:hypothetical protein [Anaerolineaceae bacterium]